MSKGKIQIVMGLIVWGLIGSVVAMEKDQSTVHTGMRFTGDSIVVMPNHPEFTIVLPGNRTTGYKWHVGTYNHHLVMPVSHHFRVHATKLFGGGGESVWVFRLDKRAFVVPHHLVIEMLYSRPWESSVAVKKEVVIHVHPQPPHKHWSRRVKSWFVK